MVSGTTPKGKGIMKNQILSQKQLWVGQQTDEIDQAPMVQISSVIDIIHLHKHIVNHYDTSPKMSSHLNPRRQRPNESNGQVEISQGPTPIDYWASVANQGYEETKKAWDQICTYALLCSQLQKEEQGSKLEQWFDVITRIS